MTGTERFVGHEGGWSPPEPRRALSATFPVPSPRGLKTRDRVSWQLCLGVTRALRLIVENHARIGSMPAVLNERHASLSDPGSGNASFLWLDAWFPPLSFPRESVGALFVRQVTDALYLSATELVVAYAVVEKVLLCRPTALSRASVRPVFIGAACLAALACNDEHVTTRMLTRRLVAYFNALNVLHVDKLMLTVFSLIGWVVPSRPDGVRLVKDTLDYQGYADGLSAAVPLSPQKPSLDCYASVADMVW